MGEVPEALESLKLWLAAPQIGAPSEIWLQRQISRLDTDIQHILTWNDLSQEPENNARCTILSSPLPGLGDLGRSRWLHRAKRWATGNYYGADRQEVTSLTRVAFSGQPPNAILAHFGHTGLRMLPLAKQLKIPCVVHFHGLDLSSMLRIGWYRKSLERNLEQFSALICVGSAQKDQLLELGADPQRIHIIPCGVPVSDFASTPQKEHAGKVEFVTIGRLVPQKGTEIVIRALATIPDNSHLTIVGDGPERSRLAAIAQELKVEHRITFVGIQTSKAVHRILEQSHVLIQHSLEVGGWSEGFGVTVAEAAAVGRPVIVSDLGGLLDQVIDGETGFVTPQRDVSALGQRMKQLALEAGLRERMGQAGLRRVVENFDTDKQVAKLRAVLVHAVEKGRKGKSSE
ncbi:glycosyltransferase family 4 protein [uncultured Limimaricola sp.]|uniref:glycosyltransferase family 4 protein n=1 Tax=uncultured Limimaricola sp. TaxID=2211667 RepID=UPI0030F98C59